MWLLQCSRRMNGSNLPATENLRNLAVLILVQFLKKKSEVLDVIYE